MIRQFAFALSILALVGCSDEKPAPKPGPDEGKLGPSENREIAADVIYGRDNRLDVYQVADPEWRDRAASTAALVRNYKLLARSDGSYTLKLDNFGKSFSLCSSEPFNDQGIGAFCSGFFVGEDLMVTAGHCVTSAADCSSMSFVFGFALEKPGATPDVIPGSRIYRCRQLVASRIGSNGEDFAVVRLDRRVTGVRPLKLRSEGHAQAGDELVVIGNPVGLPTKVAGEGIVRGVLPGFMVASLDTYAGNSGSAVFNAKSGEVEGILVRGEMDFRWNGPCRVSYSCTQDTCRGEDVTLIEYAREVLNISTDESHNY